MAMANVFLQVCVGPMARDTVDALSPEIGLATRAGDIGPVRKEVIFEPLREISAPVVPPRQAPERPVEEPVPARPQ
jgi:hypothetical protein